MDRNRFTILTEEVLEWLLVMSGATAILSGWSIQLAQLEFPVVYFNRTKQMVRDKLSRLETNGAAKTVSGIEQTIFAFSAQSLSTREGSWIENMNGKTTL